MKLNLDLCSKLALAAALVLLFFLAGCKDSSGGDEPGGTTPGGSGETVDLQTLGGYVRAAGGAPLADVTVSIGHDAGSPSAMTDATGAFIITSIGSLPVGTVVVRIDGSTAMSTGALPYPALEVMVPLPAGTTDLLLPQVVTLPDLNNAESANQSLAVDANGLALTDIAVVQQAGMNGIALEGPVGTEIRVHGELVSGGVDLNVTPVAPEEVPMPLPEGLLGNSFVTIQPGGSTFDPPGAAQGLDVTLPNDMNLAVGTMVDIWSFDHDEGAWVNRTAQTGQSGIVRTTGGVPGPDTEIYATGVITEGGWHAGVVDVDSECGTRIKGRVVEAGTLIGIPGATIAFESGQFATTDSDGCFLSELSPAYDVALFASTGTCLAQDFDYEVVLPPNYGGQSSGVLTIDAIDIVLGGMTDVAPVEFTLGTTGSVVGVVLGDFSPGAMVTLMPSAGPDLQATVQDTGSFFRTGLDAGTWIASFLFDGDTEPTVVPFTIEANQTTSIAIQASKGTGGNEITIVVIEDPDAMGVDGVPLPNARVLLQGTDSGSSAGLVAITDSTGRAVFADVTGPYNVTASMDYFHLGETTRVAASVLNITPPTGTIGMFLQPDLNPGPVTTDAQLSGTVANLPAFVPGESFQLQVVARDDPNGFAAGASVDVFTGAFSVSIPSDTDLTILFNHTVNELTSVNIRTVAGLVIPNAGQVASGGTLTANFDYANAVPFDQPLNLTFSNVSAGDFAAGTLQLVDPLTGAGLAFNLFVSTTGLSSQMVNVPDISDPMFAPYDAAIRASAGTNFSWADWTTPTPNLNLEFAGIITPINPMGGEQFTATQLQNLNVSFSQGNDGTFGANGVNLFDLYYDKDTGGVPMGVDVVEWSMFMPAGTESFSMPLAPLPMIVPGNTEVLFQFEKFREQGFTFAYQNFFSENIINNLSTLFDSITHQAQTVAVGEISTLP